MKVVAELEGQDLLEADTEDSQHLRVIGCPLVLTLVKGLRERFGKDLSKWELPKGTDHAAVLVRELLLKRTGQWSFPYAHEELCHCRAVSAHKVDQAIIAGAHSSEQVSRLTMASTACGTCRPDVEKIIQFRIKG